MAKGRPFTAVAPVQASQFVVEAMTREQTEAFLATLTPEECQQILAREARVGALSVSANSEAEETEAVSAADANGYPKNWLATTRDGGLV